MKYTEALKILKTADINPCLLLETPRVGELVSDYHGPVGDDEFELHQFALILDDNDKDKFYDSRTSDILEDIDAFKFNIDGCGMGLMEELRTDGFEIKYKRNGFKFPWEDLTCESEGSFKE